MFLLKWSFISFNLVRSKSLLYTLLFLCIHQQILEIEIIRCDCMLFWYTFTLRRNYALHCHDTDTFTTLIKVIKMLNEWKTQNDFPLSDELIKLHKLYYFLHKHKTTFSNRAPSHHMSDSNSNNEKNTILNEWISD